MRMAEIAALCFIALALVFYVLRPMFRAPKAGAQAQPRALTAAAAPTQPATALPAPGEKCF